MPRRCTVCDAKKRDEIDRTLVARSASFREIAQQFRLSMDAVYRHYCEHLPARLAQAEQAREVTAATNILGVLEESLASVRLIKDACDRWLRDPDDPTRYEIGPRAGDIDITYTAIGARGPVSRKAKLSALIDRIEGIESVLSVDLIETKHADPRELLLKAADRVTGHLELLAKLVGKLKSDSTVNVLVTPEWRVVQTALLDVLAPYPALRVQVAAALSRVAGAGLN